MRWKLTKNGDFDIHSFYNKLQGLLLLSFLEKVFRRLRYLSISFFVWTITCDKILTGDNLQSKGFNFVDQCVMCHCCEKTVDHFLLHCEKAHRLWSFVFGSFRISWVLRRSIANFLFGWWNWLGKNSSKIWNLVPLRLIWCIWRKRNQLTFEDTDRFDDQLLASFSGSLFDQSRAWRLTSSNSLSLFLSSLLYN